MPTPEQSHQDGALKVLSFEIELFGLIMPLLPLPRTPTVA